MLVVAYLSFIGLGVWLYRWGLQNYLLKENPEAPRTLKNPAAAFAVIFLSFTLWISGITGLFNQSPVWGLIGLAIALISLFAGIPRR